jgi:hypothetical protein
MKTKGSRVRTKRLKGKAYVHICFYPGGGSVSGEKKVRKGK